MHEEGLNWPPPYKVRFSPRARRISLRVTARGVEVVLPHGARESAAPLVLERHKDWLLRQLARVRPENEPGIPDSVILYGGARELPVVWSDAPTRSSAGDQVCRVYAARPEGRRPALCRWLLRRAAAALPPMLREESERYGLPFKKLTIRLQKSRWGSCSIRGDISLNAKLLFFHEEQIRAVLLHELCHTKHLNHSSQFWAFFASLNPQAAHLDRQLNKHRLLVPSWARI